MSVTVHHRVDFLHESGVVGIGGAPSTWRALPRLRERIGASSRVG
jgi:hypothetical protein